MAAKVAFSRHHRRIGAVVGEAWATEKDWLRPLPDPLPDASRHLENRGYNNSFVRVGDLDYSVPHGLTGRRDQFQLTLNHVVVRLEGTAPIEHDCRG